MSFDTSWQLFENVYCVAVRTWFVFGYITRGVCVLFSFHSLINVSGIRCPSRCGYGVHFLLLPVFSCYFCVPRVIFVVCSLVVHVFSAPFVAILRCVLGCPVIAFLDMIICCVCCFVGSMRSVWLFVRPPPFLLGFGSAVSMPRGAGFVFTAVSMSRGARLVYTVTSN